jgi:hypothetical protein
LADAAPVELVQRYILCEIQHTGGLLGHSAQGLRGRGTITIGSEHVVFTGAKGWPAWMIVFVLILTGFAVFQTTDARAWFRIPLLFVLWGIIVYVLRGGHGVERCRLTAVQAATRHGRSVQLRIDGMARLVTFLVDSAEQAEEIVLALGGEAGAQVGPDQTGS